MTFVVVPPTVDSTCRGKRAGHITTGTGNRRKRDTAGHGDRHRDVAIRCGAVADLTIRVAAPAIGSACCGSGAGVIITGLDCREQNTRWHRDGHRFVARSCRAVAEFPVIVPPPTIGRAGRSYGASVSLLSGNFRKRDTVGHRDRHRAVAIICGAVAVLAIFV